MLGGIPRIGYPRDITYGPSKTSRELGNTPTTANAERLSREET